MKKKYKINITKLLRNIFILGLIINAIIIIIKMNVSVFSVMSLIDFINL